MRGRTWAYSRDQALYPRDTSEVACFGSRRSSALYDESLVMISAIRAKHTGPCHATLICLVRVHSRLHSFT